MRRLLPLSVLLLAACTTVPPAPPASPRPAPMPVVRTGLSGLSQGELAARFGAPTFSLREGSGLKLQWQNASCVLDAYLYPPGPGAALPTVMHVDTRRPISGESVPVEPCAASLAAR